MFFVHRVVDTLAIPAHSLCVSTRLAVEQEIDEKYPGRVWMDIGLVVARYTTTTTQGNGKDNNNKDNKDKDNATDKDIVVGPGVCVAGEAASHVVTSFSLIVFRPFLEEVCVGTICASTPQGIQISLGFFDQIYVPAFWMLRPTSYEKATGLWVWTPEYDDDDNEEEEEDDDNDNNEQGQGDDDDDANNNDNAEKNKEEQDAEPTRYEMEIGSTIRFKVKSIQFARITQTAKGRQATLSTTDQPAAGLTTRRSNTNNDTNFQTDGPAVRRRSSSVGLEDDQAPPPPMKIMASICEDGLGLVSWWEAGQDDDDDEEEEEEEEEQEAANEQNQPPKEEQEEEEEEVVEEDAMEEDEVVEEEEDQETPHVKKEVKEEPA